MYSHYFCLNIIAFSQDKGCVQSRLKPEKYPQEHPLAIEVKLLFQWEESSWLVLDIDSYHHVMCSC